MPQTTIPLKSLLFPYLELRSRFFMFVFGTQTVRIRTSLVGTDYVLTYYE